MIATAAALATACGRAPSVGMQADRVQPAVASNPPAEERAAPLSDAVITAQVRTAITTDPAMAGADVSVNTDHGVVNLLGTVKSEEQTAIASGHAQRPDGVMRVDNHLAMNLQ
jgi:osmotically-inducible protein OsmY